jgi:hypothetical protein
MLEIQRRKLYLRDKGILQLMSKEIDSRKAPFIQKMTLT